MLEIADIILLFLRKHCMPYFLNYLDFVRRNLLILKVTRLILAYLACTPIFIFLFLTYYMLINELNTSLYLLLAAIATTFDILNKLIIRISILIR